MSHTCADGVSRVWTLGCPELAWLACWLGCIGCGWLGCIGCGWLVGLHWLRLVDWVAMGVVVVGGLGCIGRGWAQAARWRKEDRSTNAAAHAGQVIEAAMWKLQACRGGTC
eukprot:366082-Chlamydomonas_euryale.AAC.42